MPHPEELNIFEKTLTANDLGVNTNQSRIHIPKPTVAFFPRLNPEDYNPSVSLEVVDSQGQSFRMRFIHFNNKHVPDPETGRRGTRDEYGLTPVTELFRANEAEAGDIFRLLRVSAAVFEAFILPASPTDPDCAIREAVRRLHSVDPDAPPEGNRTPGQRETTQIRHQRDIDVVAFVLNAASGRCELCLEEAPFTRDRDGSPYLEVHHVIQLAHGGEDTVYNATALCPNCHRRLHFSTDEDKEGLIDRLKRQVARLR